MVTLNEVFFGYFEAKDKSVYKKAVEMLEYHWSECIALNEHYVDEYSRILEKKLNCVSQLASGIIYQWVISWFLYHRIFETKFKY